MDTIKNNYSKDMKIYIKNRFIKSGDAYIKPTPDQIMMKPVTEGRIEIPCGEPYFQIQKIIEESDSAIKTYELWEYEKDYSYSTFLEVNNFAELIHKINNSRKVKRFDDIKSEAAFASQSGEQPILYEKDDRLFLKYPKLYVGYTGEGHKEFFKLPIIVVFHKNLELIEIRFDSVRGSLKNPRFSSKYYLDLIKQTLEKMKYMFGAQMTAVDMQFMTLKAKDDSCKEIGLVSQYMMLCSGGSAQLDVGKNEERVLPFIDELKLFLSEHDDEFNTVPKLKQAFEEFIYEKEEMSDYPWIQLSWSDDNAKRCMQTKFTFNYLGYSFCLIKHLKNNDLIGMERMNRVAKYVSENRNDCKSTHS
ncbi:hypothetical protein ACR6HW_05095 [Fusibacter sp. JL298sf-3]